MGNVEKVKVSQEVAELFEEVKSNGGNILYFINGICSHIIDKSPWSYDTWLLKHNLNDDDLINAYKYGWEVTCIEKWKDVVGYEGLYQVSNIGRLKSLERKVKHSCGDFRNCPEKIIIQSENSSGYLTASLCSDGKITGVSIHRIVAETFIPNPENKKQVNHKDGNKKNNKIENLEWCTPKENMKHAFDIGLADAEHNEKSVIQLTTDGFFIGKYKSIAEAERITGISNQHISNVCNKKRKTTGGFKWVFADEYINIEHEFQVGDVVVNDFGNAFIVLLEKDAHPDHISLDHVNKNKYRFKLLCKKENCEKLS